MARLDKKNPPGAVRFEIDACDNAIPQKKGQDIVAMHTFVGRRVNLDPVAKSENALGSVALPHDRIERGEEGGSVDTARELCVPVEICGVTPALDLHRLQRTFFHELGDACLGGGGLQSKVISDVRFAGNTERTRSDVDEGALRIVFTRCGRLKDSRGRTRSGRS